MTIEAVSIAAAVAARFGRIFFRSAEGRNGGEGAVDFIRGVVTVDRRDFAFPQYRPQVLDIVEACGLGSLSRRLSAATRQVSVP